MPSRRTILGSAAPAVITGVSGCLGVFESYPPTGLLVVNHDDARRSVTVRVTDSEETTLFENEYTVPADGRRSDQNIVRTGPIRVTAYVDDKTTGLVESFDFDGCRQARPVITVKDGFVSRIGKQDTCRPGEEPYTR